MPKLNSPLTAADEAIRLATGGLGNVSKSATGSIADRAMREAASFRAAAAGHSFTTGKVDSAVAAADKTLRMATGGMGNIPTSATGTLMDKAMREATDTHTSIFGRMSEAEKMLATGGILGREQKLMDAAMGKSSLGKAINGMSGWRGVSAGAVGGLKDRLDTYETATEHLRKELDTSLARDTHRFSDDHFRMPALPPMPRNPILRTNELLDEMIHEIGEQRSLIEASAQAQKRETELLGKLVEAFTDNQVASDKATRRSHMQAWIGIGIAILTLMVAPFIG